MQAFVERLRSIGYARLALMGGIGVVLIAFLAFAANRLMQPTMSLLYSDLDSADGGQIAQKLDALQVPYRISPDGTRIMVPEDQVARLRMNMAEAGLPSGGSVGYELFDKNDAIGTTSFVQNINHLRALEGEIARTIRSIDRIAAARVHLVLPERQLFARDAETPSASIMLKLRSGTLDQSQVRAIQQLTAAAVPGLKPDRVSIVDDRGELLASGVPASDGTSAIDENNQKTRAYEDKLRRQLEQLIGASVGPEHVRAEVSAQMDFNRVTTQSDRFDPDSQVVRSSQTVNDRSTNSEGNGNQPTTVATNLPGQQQNQAGAATATQSQTQRTEETTNYEISRTQETIVRDGGEIKRLSVAIMVDGTYQAQPDGSRAYQPRAQADLDKMAALVKSAIGFDDSRGDQVRVENMPFVDAGAGLPAEAEPQLFLGLGKEDLFRIGEVAMLGLVAILVVIFVMRPLVNRMGPQMALAGVGGADALPAPANAMRLPAPDHAEPPPPPVPDTSFAEEFEHMVDLANIEGKVRASSLNRVGEIVTKHPEEAVAIMRNWMYRDGSR